MRSYFYVKNLKMTSESEFRCVKDFNESVRYICKSICNADVTENIKIVGEYVLDSIFAHEKENMIGVSSYSIFSLKQINEYNKTYRRCFKENGKISPYVDQVDLLNLYLLLLKGSDTCVARSVDAEEFKDDESTSTANANKVSHRYELTRLSMLQIKYKIDSNGEQISGIVDFINCNPLGSHVPIKDITESNRYYDKLEDIPRAKLLPISIPRIHSEEDFYAKHFTDNDFNHNKLRKVIIELVKEQMSEISRYIDVFKDLPDCEYEDEISNKGYPFINIKTIKLLIEYAIKLYDECDSYLKDKVFGEKIELKI